MGDDKRKPDLPIVKDEPGWAERFQRGLKRALETPPQNRPASKRQTRRQQKREPDS